MCDCASRTSSGVSSFRAVASAGCVSVCKRLSEGLADCESFNSGIGITGRRFGPIRPFAQVLLECFQLPLLLNDEVPLSKELGIQLVIIVLKMHQLSFYFDQPGFKGRGLGHERLVRKKGSHSDLFRLLIVAVPHANARRGDEFPGRRFIGGNGS